MAKKANQYKLTLEQITLANGEAGRHEPLILNFSNHDEIFNIIEKLKQKNHFNDEQQTTEFAIGLKLFSEIMIKNRTLPLFEELLPAFKFFMEKLKAE